MAREVGGGYGTQLCLSSASRCGADMRKAASELIEKEIREGPVEERSPSVV